MAKIFISYHRTSKDIVEQLVQDLRDDGHKVWHDQQLTGGQKWWDNILFEIRACEIFVVALTPASLESRACQQETKYARDVQRIRLPVRLSDKVLPDSLPPELSKLHWVDYSRLDKQALKSLQRSLRNLPKAPPLPDPLPDPPPVPISPLSYLRSSIDTESQLPFQDQSQLVSELRSHFLNGSPPKEIIALIQRLKKRPDLFAVVAKEISFLEAEINIELERRINRSHDKGILGNIILFFLDIISNIFNTPLTISGIFRFLIFAALTMGIISAIIQGLSSLK